MHTSAAIKRLAAVFGYVSEPQSSGRDYVAGGETQVQRGRFCYICMSRKIAFGMTAYARTKLED